MKRNIICFFCCVVLFSCATKTEVIIPANVLNSEKMAAVLVDMQLLEASMNRSVYNVDRTVNVDKSVVESPSPTIDVLKKNEITKQQYDESFDFYAQHPDLLLKIYEQVLNELSKMQAEVMNKN